MTDSATNAAGKATADAIALVDAGFDPARACRFTAEHHDTDLKRVDEAVMAEVWG